MKSKPNLFRDGHDLDILVRSATLLKDQSKFEKLFKAVVGTAALKALRHDPEMFPRLLKITIGTSLERELGPLLFKRSDVLLDAKNSKFRSRLMAWLPILLAIAGDPSAAPESRERAIERLQAVEDLNPPDGWQVVSSDRFLSWLVETEAGARSQGE